MLKKSLSAFAIICAVSSYTNAQERIVLIEQFTNSGCPPCAAVTPPVFSFTNNNLDKVVAIAYHTNFPYKDSMHLENASENNQRVEYYSVAQVPYTVMDGNVFSGTSATFNSNTLTRVNNRLAVNARYVISADSLNLTNNNLRGTFKFTSANAANATENLVAHVVVIEKNVLKSAYTGSPGENAENEYGYVMRKLLPDVNGTNMINKTLNGSDEITINWTVTKVKVNEEVRVVAFIQNNVTKEIYQAKMFTPINLAMGLTNHQKSNSNSLIVYPNPSAGNLTLAFDDAQMVESLTVINQIGETVYTQNIGIVTKEIQSDVVLHNGIYFLIVHTNNGTVSRKVIIVK